jgi:glycosyl transferase family 25
MPRKRRLDPMTLKTLVLVISIHTSAERRALFQASAQTSVPWQFFDACTTLGANLSYEASKAQIAHGRELSSGEIGAYSSHFSLWERLIADPDYDRYIILEDDTIVDWTYIEKLCDTDIGEIGFLKLFYLRNGVFRTVRRNLIHRHWHILRIFGHAYGMLGYMVTKRTAVEFVGYFSNMVRPIDDAIDRSWETGFEIHAVFPFPVIERFGESTIGGSRFEPTPFPRRLRWKRLFAIAGDKIEFHIKRILFVLRLH